VRFGPLHLPPRAGALEEGDAILHHPSLACDWAGRQRLAGGVFGANLALNLDDATQVH